MYSRWDVNLLVIVGTALAVASAVLLHYEGLRWLSLRLMARNIVRRRKVLFGVYGVIALHVAEIWLFGLCVWGLLQVPDAGTISGTVHPGLLDAVYLSATSFSTLGFGDVTPIGAVRFVIGTEALAGFILITWSASFLYLEMREHWGPRA